jgi:hypothetical protein
MQCAQSRTLPAGDVFQAWLMIALADGASSKARSCGVCKARRPPSRAGSTASKSKGWQGFFTERYPDTVQTVQPLRPQESSNLNYLYVVAIAAGKAGRTDPDQQAAQHLIGVAQDSAALHLLIGKVSSERRHSRAVVGK